MSKADEAILSVHMPRTLHAATHEAAAREGRSLKEFISRALRARIAQGRDA